jgi:hypothetical protein
LYGHPPVRAPFWLRLPRSTYYEGNIADGASPKTTIHRRRTGAHCARPDAALRSRREAITQCRSLSCPSGCCALTAWNTSCSWALGVGRAIRSSGAQLMRKGSPDSDARCAARKRAACGMFGEREQTAEQRARSFAHSRRCVSVESSLFRRRPTTTVPS